MLLIMFDFLPLTVRIMIGYLPDHLLQSLPPDSLYTSAFRLDKYFKIFFNLRALFNGILSFLFISQLFTRQKIIRHSSV